MRVHIHAPEGTTAEDLIAMAQAQGIKLRAVPRNEVFSDTSGYTAPPDGLEMTRAQRRRFHKALKKNRREMNAEMAWFYATQDAMGEA